jgi:hypothetical protein
MKLLLKIAYIALTVAFVIYVALPSPDFPNPPDDALQSQEPADTETPLRKAYFTDYTREEVVAHYKREFSGFPVLNLNYPPEEGQSIIRDQTRSSYLEELVHPFRESIYINGFVPKVRKDAIVIGDNEYHQKLTVRYVPGSSTVRMVYALLTSVTLYFVIIFAGTLLVDYFTWLKKKGTNNGN